MLSYILRRLLYAIPILFGVMVLTFVLFFMVQSPRTMAKRILGPKASPQAVDDWLRNQDLDKPLFINREPGKKVYDSLFFSQMTAMATFKAGKSYLTGEPVMDKFKRGMIPSLLITLPAFLLGLYLDLTASLFLAFVRRSMLDMAGVVLCVVLMSIPIMVYVVFGQWLVAMVLSWLPAFGFSRADVLTWESCVSTATFLVLPVLVYVVAGLGGEIRLYRTIFLEEVSQDYVRTAQAKGASGSRVLFVHVLKNGMISLITLVVASLPFLIMGSLVIENFFGIPGLGSLTIDAVRTSDFAVVRTAVYLGSLLYLGGLLLTDVCYAMVDPRIRFK